MSLHNDVMNIPATGADDYDELPNEKVAYKIGHRDARHEAAEMALVFDNLLEVLRDVKDMMYAQDMLDTPVGKSVCEAIFRAEGAK